MKKVTKVYPIIEISGQAHKYLTRWAKDEFYVYIRPLSSRFTEPSAKKFRIHWAVTVEYRGMEYKQHRAEGYDLSEVICKLGKEVPRRKTIPMPPRPTTKTKINVTMEKPKKKKGKKKRVK